MININILTLTLTDFINFIYLRIYTSKVDDFDTKVKATIRLMTEAPKMVFF